MTRFITHIITFALSFLTVFRQLYDEPPMWLMVLIIKATHPMYVPIRSLALVYHIHRGNSLMIFENLVYFIVSFILHVDRVWLFAVVSRFRIPIYRVQSGEYGKSKYHARSKGARSEVRRDLKKVQEKIRSGKNGSSDKMRKVVSMKKTSLERMKYIPHSGSFRFAWGQFANSNGDDPSGIFRFNMLSEFLFSVCMVHFPRLTYNLLVFVGVKNAFMDTLRVYLDEVCLSYARELRLLRNACDGISSISACVSNSSLVRNVFQFNSNNIEKWVIVSVGLMTSTNLTNACSILLGHLKSYYSTSICTELIGYFKTLTRQEGFEEQSMDTIVNHLKRFLSDWNSLRSSKLFKRVTDIIALVVCSGMCKLSNLDITIGGVTLFTDNMRKRIENANVVDITQMSLEAATYFIEVGYLCFKKGSLRPILFNDTEAYEYDEKMLRFLKVTPFVLDGDWIGSAITYEEYQSLYTDLFTYLKTVHSTMMQGPQKKIIWDKMILVDRLKSEFDRRHNSGSLRKAPYVICVYGPSSVGKTSVGSILNMVAVKASGGSGDQAKKITYNEGDAYFSNCKCDVETIVMDDMCNTKPEFLQSSPLAQLIKFNNNNPEYAVMPDVDSKGKIPLRPKTVLITTNVHDLMAEVFSNEPVSILRRLNIRVTVRVLPEFAKEHDSGNLMLDPEKATVFCSTLTGVEALYPNMWSLDVHQCVPVSHTTRGRSDTARFDAVYCDYKKSLLVNCTLQDVATYVARAARKYSLTQETLVAKQTTLHHLVNFCPICHDLDVSCKCDRNEQAGEDEERSPLFFDPPAQVDPLEIPDIEYPIELEYTPTGEGIWHTHILPMWEHICTLEYLLWLLTRLRTAIWEVYWFALLEAIIRVTNIGTWFGMVVHAIGIMRGCWLLGKHYVCFFLHYQITRERLRRNQLRPHHTIVHCVEMAIPVATKLFVLGLMWNIFKSMKVHFYDSKPRQEQSSLEPSETEYRERRATANPWVIPGPTRLPAKGLVRTVDPNVLKRFAESNSVHVRSGTQIVGGFYACTHFLLLPQHFVKHEEMELVITPSPSLMNYHRYKVKISEATSYRFPNTDLMLVYAPGGCEKKDLLPFFNDNVLSGRGVADFIFRKEDGNILRDKVGITYGSVTTTRTYPGGHYNFSELNTFCGMCMGVFISDSKYPQILGFHLGGITGSTSGCLGYVRRSVLSEALDRLHDIPGICRTAEKDEIPTIMYEEHLGSETFMLGRDLAPNCSTRFLDDNASITVLGACKGAVTNKSQVIVSHISQSVVEILGVPRTHGPPAMGPPQVPRWHNWALGMSGFSNPAIGPSPGILVCAVNDYLHGLLTVDFKAVVPLDYPSIVNGIDGDRFINRMPQNTSVGFPLSGPLSAFCTLLPSIPQHEVNFGVNSSILEVYNTYLDLYRQGKRAYPVFRAALKDEPVKIGKKKVRVFQAAPIALKMILRQFFLPIAAHLSMFPLRSECAVGVNAFGDEWGEMMSYVDEYGTDRIVAGDYSAYDQRMPAVLTSAAFDILIELAKRSGYSKEDIVIMRSVVADVIYPCLAYNGTLVMLHGGNPSGHNLTVYINSIVNSLISRCAFKTIYPRGFFRDSVHMMTYGDDDIGSVKCGYDQYNNISKANYINSIGMTYTPPSKEGEHIAYLELSGVDFLKRQDLYNVDLQRRIGVLDLGSIHKSLHARMDSKEISPSEWAGSVVDGALREIAPRGEVEYERYRCLLGQVAVVHDFTFHSKNLSKTYFEMINEIA